MPPATIGTPIHSRSPSASATEAMTSAHAIAVSRRFSEIRRRGFGNAGRITSSAPEALVRTPGVLVAPTELLCLLVALQLAVVLLGLSSLLLERRRARPPILEVQRHPPLRQIHPAAHPHELLITDFQHRSPLRRSAPRDVPPASSRHPAPRSVAVADRDSHSRGMLSFSIRRYSACRLNPSSAAA